MDELPRCGLCGAVPVQPHGPDSTVTCWNSNCDAWGQSLPVKSWRRLHGPRLAPEHVEALRAMLDHGHKLWVREAIAIRAALAALGEE